MVSSEVQRTLVKSPPELWAEISDPASLARHLDEFGEIRITRVQPEQRVEWEAEHASGTVVIKPSGWGTKVKLTVTRELVLDDAAPELVPPPDDHAPPKIDAELDLQPELDADAELEPEGEPPRATEVELSFDAEPEPEPELTAEPEPRRGFFARLFGRRRVASPAIAESSSDEQPDGVTPAQPVPEPDPVRAPEPEPEPVPVPEPKPDPNAEQRERPDEQQRSDIAAELAAAEEVAAEQVAAVLTGVLDRLGAAHHRPFSRA